MQIKGIEIENGDVVVIKTITGKRRVGFFIDHRKSLWHGTIGRTDGIHLTDRHFEDYHSIMWSPSPVRESEIDTITKLVPAIGAHNIEALRGNSC